MEGGSNGGDKSRSWAIEIAALVRDSASGKRIGQLPTPRKKNSQAAWAVSLRDNRFLVIAPSSMALDGFYGSYRLLPGLTGLITPAIHVDIRVSCSSTAASSSPVAIIKSDLERIVTHAVLKTSAIEIPGRVQCWIKF